ncbi:hypothetical protein [Streptomyces tauricus]
MSIDRPSYRLSSGQTEAQVDGMVRQIASRLTAHRPEMVLTAAARIAVVQATTMSPPLATALRGRLPEITGQITRAAYAARLLEDLGGEQE